MNTVLTEPRNVLDPDGRPTGQVVIEALIDDAYTHRTRTAGRIRFRGTIHDDVEIVGLFVDRAARCRGLGTRLIDDMIRCFSSQERSFSRVWIEVTALGMCESSMVDFLKSNQFRFSGCTQRFPLLMERGISHCEPQRLCLESDGSDPDFLGEDEPLDETETVVVEQVRRSRRRGE